MWGNIYKYIFLCCFLLLFCCLVKVTRVHDVKHSRQAYMHTILLQRGMLKIHSKSTEFQRWRQILLKFLTIMEVIYVLAPPSFEGFIVHFCFCMITIWRNASEVQIFIDLFGLHTLIQTEIFSINGPWLQEVLYSCPSNTIIHISNAITCLLHSLPASFTWLSLVRAWGRVPRLSVK